MASRDLGVKTAGERSQKSRRAGSRGPDSASSVYMQCLITYSSLQTSHTLFHIRYLIRYKVSSFWFTLLVHNLLHLSLAACRRGTYYRAVHRFRPHGLNLKYNMILQW